MTREPNRYRYAPEEIGELNQTIDRLRAENERLRAALIYIIELDDDGEAPGVARAALEPKP